MIRVVLFSVLACAAVACSDTSDPAPVPTDTDGETSIDVTPATDTVAEDMVSVADVVSDTMEDTTIAEDTQVLEDTQDLADVPPAGPDIPEADVNAEFGVPNRVATVTSTTCKTLNAPTTFHRPVGQNGVDVVLKNVIVTGLFSDTMFVAEEARGLLQYCGLHAWYTHTDLGIGTIIDLVGSYSEYYECIQIYSESWISADRALLRKPTFQSTRNTCPPTELSLKCSKASSSASRMSKQPIQS